MLNLGQIVVFLLLTLLPTNFSTAQEIRFSSNQIDGYLKNSVDKYADKDAQDWGARLYRLLAADRDVDKAARALAEDDRFSIEIERSLISLWIASAELHDSQERSQNPNAYASKVSQLKQQSIEAARASGYASLVIQLVTDIVYSYDRCQLDSFQALIAEASDALAVGLTAAQEKQCTSWWLALHARFPDNTAIRAALSGKDQDLALAHRLALLQGLNSPAPSTQQLRVSLMLDYVSELWRGGLIEDGLAVVDSAAEADRRLALNDEPLSQFLTVDGISIERERDRGEALRQRRGDFRLDYVAALYLNGRVDAARVLFDALPYTQELRSLWDCVESDVKRGRGTTQDRCETAHSSLSRQWQLIESTFNHPEEDPYLLIEGGPSIDYDSALWVEIARRRLTGDNYEWLRQNLAQSWVRRQRYRAAPELEALTLRFLSNDLRERSGAFDRRIRSALAAWNVTLVFDPVVSRRTAASPSPLPLGFRELPLPEALRTRRNEKEGKLAWPDGMSQLPKGFGPVRVERGTSMTVAVSLSQNLDPVGEVSEGAYWIHLSRDGGATWNEPLYTGLPEYFPYAVMPTSKMSLWSGDRITLEVAVQELDISSISYPPISLRSRRRASDLYLEISIAALQSDRDGDGVTDIIEEHLLLNPDNPDSDGDGLADGRDPLPNVRNTNPANDNGYFTSILQHIFGLPEGAIIESVDRGPGLESIFEAQRAQEPSTMRPLIVQGSAADFVGVRLTTPVLVYSETEVARLLARSADFHALSLSPVVFNRAHDRGYVVWDRGWTGGTLRVIRETTSWRIEVMSGWIS